MISSQAHLPRHTHSFLSRPLSARERRVPNYLLQTLRRNIPHRVMARLSCNRISPCRFEHMYIFCQMTLSFYSRVQNSRAKRTNETRSRVFHVNLDRKPNVVSKCERYCLAPLPGRTGILARYSRQAPRTFVLTLQPCSTSIETRQWILKLNGRQTSRPTWRCSPNLALR